MSEPTFTPGPWSVWLSSGDRPYVQAQPNGPIVAKTYRDSVGFGTLPGEANAGLIAAAPDFYSASQSTIDRLADLPRWLLSNGNGALATIIDEELERHRRALAKARGET